MTILRISKYQFEVSDPYSAGSVLTEGEAAALNALRAENIRNNCMGWVSAEKEELSAGELLPSDVLSVLQTRFTEYDQQYIFGARRQNRRLGLIEAEVERVAKEFAEAQARGQGRELSDSELAEMLPQVQRLREVQEEARRRVAERERVVAASLESLL